MNVSALESPFIPVPDCGAKVFTYAVPGLVIRLYGTWANTVRASCRALTSFCPFHSTTVPTGNGLPRLATTVMQKYGLCVVVDAVGHGGFVGTPLAGGPAGNPDGDSAVIVAPVV